MIKAVIFDLDGVIAKTDNYHYLAWKKTCEEHHLFFDKDLNNELRGVSRQNSLNIILKHNKFKMNEDSINQILSEENQYFNEIISKINETDLFTGIIDVFKELKVRNIKIGVGTMTKHSKEIIDGLNIRSYFDAIVDGNMVVNSKPDPEVFLSCAKLLEVNPTETLVIEDGKSGIEAANAGGFISVAIRNVTSLNIAKFNIDDITEVLDVLKSVESE